MCAQGCEVYQCPCSEGQGASEVLTRARATQKGPAKYTQPVVLPVFLIRHCVESLSMNDAVYKNRDKKEQLLLLLLCL